ncbi:DNA cytosine methyltransferase [Helicobacter pylori]|uniref:DNA cytosine methyltransferase n=1 Tax=Helicobacter pylori TaxID=210 RepID=UPI001920E20C|nr:DNA cytosine methyltransferase [Helicobacter pylori]QQW87915.1 DNA cytosine methyltransferase [Helicobacter pylori]WQW45899.1 DNA cytosine methyltransferase [Helicobacter pylori]
MLGVSLFSSAGIAEMYLKELGIKMVVANELIPKRAELHKWLYPECEMVIGDIRDTNNFTKIYNIALEKHCKFLLATPPCQGMSSLGKKDYNNDERNYLVFDVFKLIDKSDFDYILIENVPKFLKLYFPYKDKPRLLLDIIKDKYTNKYNIESFILNAKDYGVAQSRPRGFIKIWKKGLKWDNPKVQKEISLREAIFDLPSLESGEKSNLKWHYAKKHNPRDVLALKHTREGKSAMKNEFYYPKKENGDRIIGFHNTYKRMKWDEPAPARAINSGNMGGHNNVHPGRLKSDGTYSDARVLTLRELFILSSLPADWDLPSFVSETLIRTVIGEAIPPLFCKNIISGIK